jgi:hypothetical protein
MSWRKAYNACDMGPGWVKDQTFDMLEAAVGGSVRLYATPRQWIDPYGAWRKGPWGLLITKREVTVGKKGIFGINVALRVPISNFRKYGVRPQGGHGPLYEVQTLLSEGGTISFLFTTLDAAEAVGEYINSGVALAGEGHT